MRTMALLPLAGLLTACTSYGATNSPVTAANAVTVPELVGRWRTINEVRGHEGGDTMCVTIPSATTRPLRVRMDGCRAGVRQTYLLADFTRLGGELFVALQPDIADTTVSIGEDVLSLFTFYRIRVRNDSMLVAGLDADSLRGYLVTHPTEIPFALLSGNGPDVLVTGTPDQLAAFLASHARDSTLFWDESALAFSALR
jgi:hypothetical protein